MFSIIKHKKTINRLIDKVEVSLVGNEIVGIIYYSILGIKYAKKVKLYKHHMLGKEIIRFLRPKRVHLELKEIGLQEIDLSGLIWVSDSMLFKKCNKLEHSLLQLSLFNYIHSISMLNITRQLSFDRSIGYDVKDAILDDMKKDLQTSNDITARAAKDLDYLMELLPYINNLSTSYVGMLRSTGDNGIISFDLDAIMGRITLLYNGFPAMVKIHNEKYWYKLLPDNNHPYTFHKQDWKSDIERDGIWLLCSIGLLHFKFSIAKYNKEG